MTAERTCPGYCCETIYQPFDPTTLFDLRDTLLDGRQIADMLKPTGVMSAGRWHYRCRNFDPTTRLCIDYENRPAICRDYPYGQECEHCGLMDGIPPAERLALERQEA